MVDIPEHLLQRSLEARARLTGAPAPDAAPAAAAAPEPEAAEIPEADVPAEQEVAPVAAVAAVSSVIEEQPTPESGGQLEQVDVVVSTVAVPEVPKVYAPPSVVAGTRKKYRGAKVPGWLIPVYAVVPLLVLALVATMFNVSEEQAAKKLAAGPNGAALYAANCAACHGPDGGGAVGPALDTVVEVFPDFRETFEWISHIAVETDGPYGENGQGNGGAGARKGAMPAFGIDFGGNLDNAELYAVTAFIREEFGGADPAEFPPRSEFGIETPGGEGGEGGEGGADGGMGGMGGMSEAGKPAE
jgi:mono/diheme cytochrome c family protein